MRIVIVGGVAGGMSAAARARRLDEHAEIVVLERSPYVSFANCGLPYHLAGEIEQRSALLLHTPESLRAQLNLDVRVNSLVTLVDRAAREVEVAGPAGTYRLGYDALILSPGAEPATPPIAGLAEAEAAGLAHRMYTIPDLDALMSALSRHTRPRVVVVGAGFIGLEAVEALTNRGAEVTLVEFAPHVLPVLDEELAPLLDSELRSHGVQVRTSCAVEAIEVDGGRAAVRLSGGTTLETDLVLLSVGVTPRSELARQAGLELAARGAIVVDGSMRTSDPHIWAVGDAVQLRQCLGGEDHYGFVPLAAPANRHGRLAASSIVRGTAGPAAPPRVLGTAIVRVFGLVAAVTGASKRALEGRETVRVHLHPASHAGYYPGAQTLHIAASFSPDGRLLGAQIVGSDGVDKRIDVLATALYAGLGADELADLDLAYAPPFGSAKDPVNMLGFTAQNILDGTVRTWDYCELEAAQRDGLILDVRSAGECAQWMVAGALNIPHTELRERLAEVRAAAAGRPVFVHCRSGVRSYLATRILTQHGFDARNLSGGSLTLEAQIPCQEGLPANTSR